MYEKKELVSTYMMPQSSNTRPSRARTFKSNATSDGCTRVTLPCACLLRPFPPSAVSATTFSSPPPAGAASGRRPNMGASPAKPSITTSAGRVAASAASSASRGRGLLPVV